jgi:hypothetical protein
LADHASLIRPTILAHEHFYQLVDVGVVTVSQKNPIEKLVSPNSNDHFRQPQETSEDRNPGDE